MASFAEIGRRLRDARTNRGVSIAALSRATRVPEVQLEALERGEVDTMSTAALFGFLMDLVDRGIVDENDAREAAATITRAPGVSLQLPTWW